jgi:hypothetical protein
VKNGSVGNLSHFGSRQEGLHSHIILPLPLSFEELSFLLINSEEIMVAGTLAAWLDGNEGVLVLSRSECFHLLNVETEALNRT